MAIIPELFKIYNYTLRTELKIKVRHCRNTVLSNLTGVRLFGANMEALKKPSPIWPLIRDIDPELGLTNGFSTVSVAQWKNDYLHVGRDPDLISHGF